MKSRPILFNGEMVRAILDGSKTQTRRPFKAPKWVDDAEAQDFIDALNKHDGKCAKRGPCDGLRSYVGPYGVPGDELWVREAFNTMSAYWCGVLREGTADPDVMAQAYKFACDYRADRGDKPYPFKWTPSIHMPRWASRITLRVTDVRVQRLRDITPEDARAEGFTNPAHFITAFQAMYPGEANPWLWAIGFGRVRP